MYSGGSGAGFFGGESVSPFDEAIERAKAAGGIELPLKGAGGEDPGGAKKTEEVSGGLEKKGSEAQRVKDRERGSSALEAMTEQEKERKAAEAELESLLGRLTDLEDQAKAQYDERDKSGDWSVAGNRDRWLQCNHSYIEIKKQMLDLRDEIGAAKKKILLAGGEPEVEMPEPLKPGSSEGGGAGVDEPPKPGSSEKGGSSAGSDPGGAKGPEIDKQPTQPLPKPQEQGGAKEDMPSKPAEEAEQQSEEEEDIETEEREKAAKSAKTKAAIAAAIGIPVALSAVLSSFGGAIGSMVPKSEGVMDGSTPIEMNVDGIQSEGEVEHRGIYDGYDEIGMWGTDGKSGPYAFANGSEVAKLFNNDECDMVKYTAGNQVESFADYLANLPEQLQPDGFKGLGIVATEQKLESLSVDEYEQVQQQFNDIIDQAFTRVIKAEGEYDNAYIRMKDANGGKVHGNMEIVKSTTRESKEFKQLYWVDADGNEIGNMTVKLTPIYDEEGNFVGLDGCIQVINKKGEKSSIYVHMPDVQDDDGDNPDGDNPDGGGEETKKPDSGGSESAPNESAPNESTPNESAPNESAPNESAPDESAPDESAPNESGGGGEEDDSKTDVLPGGKGDGWGKKSATHEEPSEVSRKSEENGGVEDHAEGTSSGVAESDALRGGDTGGDGEKTDAVYDGTDTRGWHGVDSSTAERGTQKITEPAAPVVNNTNANPGSAARNNTEQENEAAVDEVMNRIAAQQDGQSN